jgi:hypothetical protein
MSRVWTEEERDSCRAAVRQDNPLFTDVEIEIATDVWLKFTEQMEQRLLYGRDLLTRWESWAIQKNKP